MSDIAMLVAEEYERRTKVLRKEGGVVAVGAGDFGIVSSASVLASRLMEKVGAEKKKLVKLVSEFEPKSKFGVAASDSFFSA